MVESFVRALEARDIDPLVDRVFEFDEIPRAYDHLASGAHLGRSSRAFEA